MRYPDPPRDRKSVWLDVKVHALPKKRPVKKHVPQKHKTDVGKSSKPTIAKASLHSKEFYCPKARCQAPTLGAQPELKCKAFEPPQTMVVERPATKPIWSIWD